MIRQTPRSVTFRAFTFAAILALAPAAAGVFLSGAAPAPQSQAGSVELMFDQGKRSFDAAKWEDAVASMTSIVAALTAGGQVQKPDLLAQVYELRARARFNTGDSQGAEQDFSALLLVKPGYTLAAGISPRVVKVFDSVKKLTVGEVAVSMTPAGEVQIDGRTYSVQVDPQSLALPAGEHSLTAVRQGYRSLEQKFTVIAGTTAPLALTLERTSATLSVISIPDGVEVILDGASRGSTAKGGSGVESAALVIGDLQPGNHRLQLRRDCYKELERTITIEKPDDLKTDPLRLTQAIATVKVQSPEPASVFVDGASRGPAPADLTVCEGTHLIEVKGTKGRFVDRRDWKTGDSTTLTADLRAAFPIIASKGATGPALDQLRTSVERALAPAKHILVYVPTDADVEAALKGESVPPDWLTADPVDGGPAPSRIPKEVKRELGRKLAAKLQAQGLASVTVGADPYNVQVLILGAGSGEPDVITVNVADPASQARAVQIIGAPLPPLVRPSIETAVVDVMGSPGATVVRAIGVGAKAGLVVGDVIVGAAGQPVASVADLRAKIAAVRPPATDISLDVKGPTGATRKVPVPVTMAPDAIGLRDTNLLYNRALIELNDMVKSAATPVERAAARVNLAIVDMRLGNWDDALVALKDAQLPDGPGVSAGTVNYLTGLCLKSAGRTSEAQAAFTKAAASPQARLSNEGALIAPLAKQELRR